MSFLRQQPLIHLPGLPGSGTCAGPTQKNSKAASPSTSPPKSIFNPLFNFVKHPGDVIRDFTIDEAGKQRLVLQARLKNAKTHSEWIEAATLLDELDGNNRWKSESESSEYDANQVKARLDQLEEARISGDVGRMLFLIRTTLTRHLGGMGNVELYRHSYTGTKYLIELYIETALATLDALVNAPSIDPQLSPKKILESLVATRQSFGRTALLLSGGATFGMNHIGVLKALWEADLLPRIISGASAGAIVAAVLCVRTDNEIPHTLVNFPYGELNVFDNSIEPEGLMARVGRMIKMGAWMDIANLTRVMRGMLGDITFQEAYNRTRRILNICVSPASVYELPQLLNYLTAPNVLIWSAVAASCSLPLLFTPASVLAKNPKTGIAEPWNASPQKWIDGSVDNDLPMTRLAEMFNVNHFIVSQVNPHVVPFLEKEPSRPINPQDNGSSESRGGYEAWKSTFVSLAVGEALHRINFLTEMGIFPTSLTKAKSILSQKYAGDITIFPEVPLVDLQKLIKNPTPEFMIEAGLRGERATWPRLSRIKNCCAIELALDRCIHQLRTRVVFSGSQVDLRLNNLNNKNDKESQKISNISRKRPVTGDPAELASFVPPPPRSVLPKISIEGQPQNWPSHTPVTTRCRSNSTGPPQLPQFSPLITQTLASGKSYFENLVHGSPNAPRTLHSMNSAKLVAPKSPKSSSILSSSNKNSVNLNSVNLNSPSASKQIPDEGAGVALRRIGSRYRLVRQTTSSELDPADAEVESAAIASSSEDEDPFQLPESLEDHEIDDPDQTPSSSSSSFICLPSSETSQTNILQRQPFISRSTTALLLYNNTYLPNDEANSSRIIMNTCPASSTVPSPVSTMHRSTSSSGYNRPPPSSSDLRQDNES